VTGPRAARLPDPAGSRAVLIGVSAYTRLPPIPACRANVEDLAGVLTDRRWWGLPTAHCRVVTDPATAQDLLDPLHAAAAEATDALIVYYAGHGLLDRGQLELALVAGAADALHHAVAFAQVRRELLTTGARCRSKIVIIDCCFSGRAMSDYMDAGEPLAEQTVIDGAYLLTATSETVLARAPAGERHTTFTGALLRTLRSGVPGGPDPLDLDTMADHVAADLRGRGEPAPQRRSRNAGHRVALVRNVAIRPASSPDVSAPDAASAPPGPRTPDRHPITVAGRPRPRWVIAAVLGAAAVAVAAATWAVSLHRTGGHPNAGGTAGTAPASAGGLAAPAAIPPSTATPAPSAVPSLPKAQNVTASTLHEVATTDGSVRIEVTAVGDGYSYIVITPAVSCTVTGADDGQSSVVPLGGDAWVRLIPLRSLDPPVDDARDPKFDIPVVFSVEAGRGAAPTATRPCTT
jgi:hypothetical protein